MGPPTPTTSQTLNEETPPHDSAVAVEWWFRFDDDGEPELDTHHGVHAAGRVADVVEHGNVVEYCDECFPQSGPATEKTNRFCTPAIVSSFLPSFQARFLSTVLARSIPHHIQNYLILLYHLL